MTTTYTGTEGSDESWAADIHHLAQLHAAMLVAPAGSCGELKQKINELERRLGMTYEAAVARGLIAR